MTGSPPSRLRSPDNANDRIPVAARAIDTTMPALAWPANSPIWDSAKEATARIEANVALASSREWGKPRMTRMATTAGMAVRTAASIRSGVTDQVKMESTASRARAAAATRPVAETGATCQGA